MVGREDCRHAGKQRPAEGSAVRDKARFVFPGLAAALALAGILLVGPSSAGRITAARHSGTAGTGRASAGQAGAGQAASSADRAPAPGLTAGSSDGFAVPVSLLSSRKQAVAPLGALRPADLMVVAPKRLPASALASIQRLHGVTAAQSLDAARLHLNGKVVAMLGVDPSAFRVFAAKPTARSNRLWRGVASGDVAVSYTMGKLDKLPLGGKVTVAGARKEKLRVGGFATVGIPGVDAVVSDSTARSLGFPRGNAIVVSAPHARLSTLLAQIRRLVPHTAAVQPLVSQAAESGTSGAAGISGVSAQGINGYPTLTTRQLTAFLRAALSRRGMPYVWGGAGPKVFDCSGLVQWSLRQAGIVMPRVAADQALTGPRVPLSKLAAGDLLFYHTDPSAPNYISHVAIYLGHGLMIQAPEPGMDVEVVPVALGSGFAGAVRVDPRIAAQAAGSTV
jgi:cell wall-associated NlpC family hydrolase